MKTTLKNDITIKEVCDGFVYNELEGKGLFGLSGKLTIQPEYQRNYIYADGKRVVALKHITSGARMVDPIRSVKQKLTLWVKYESPRSTVFYKKL